MTTIPKMTQRTWLGQRGENGETLLTSNRLGERIIVHRWLEDGQQGSEGEVTVCRVTGDAWRRPNSFREFSKQTLINPTDDEILTAIESA